MANLQTEVGEDTKGEKAITMPGGDYTFSSGTSMATAYVSGIAALVKSDKPELTAVQLAAILKKSHQDTFEQTQILSLGGILDAYLCLQNAES